MAKILILPLWLALLFGKWVEKDNEFWPNPYSNVWKSNNKEKIEDAKRKVGMEEENIRQKKKRVIKSKNKTEEWKKYK